MLEMFFTLFRKIRLVANVFLTLYGYSLQNLSHAITCGFKRLNTDFIVYYVCDAMAQVAERGEKNCNREGADEITTTGTRKTIYLLDPD